MKDAAILYPVFALAAWTFLVLMRLAVTRFKSELSPSDFAVAFFTLSNFCLVTLWIGAAMSLGLASSI